MAQPRLEPGRYLVAERDQPLIAIPVEENGREVTYYFVDEDVIDEVLPGDVAEALALAGAWRDLEGDELDALDRIRHASRPTLPLEPSDIE